VAVAAAGGLEVYGGEHGENDAAVDRVVRGFMQRLASETRAVVVSVPVRRSPRQRPIYNLVFSSRHPAGLWTFGHCTALADAVKAKRLASNPATGIDGLPRKTARRHVYLSSEDVSRLADESGRHRSLVLTLAYCGLRWGEAVALRVGDIEFLRRRIRVCDNAVQLGVDHAIGATKGKESRSVPVPNFVLDELSRQVQGRGADDLVFGDGIHYLPRPKSRYGWFQGAVNRACVQKISPHDLRHTCASLAVSAGANVLALARMLGHKKASVTLRVYSDLFDTDLDALADVMDTAYAGKCGQNAATAVSRWR
jgi:integrase